MAYVDNYTNTLGTWADWNENWSENDYTSTTHSASTVVTRAAVINTRTIVRPSPITVTAVVNASINLRGSVNATPVGPITVTNATIVPRDTTDATPVGPISVRSAIASGTYSVDATALGPLLDSSNTATFEYESRTEPVPIGPLMVTRTAYVGQTAVVVADASTLGPMTVNPAVINHKWIVNADPVAVTIVGEDTKIDLRDVTLATPAGPAATRQAATYAVDVTVPSDLAVTTVYPATIGTNTAVLTSPISLGGARNAEAQGQNHTITTAIPPLTTVRAADIVSYTFSGDTTETNVLGPLLWGRWAYIELGEQAPTDPARIVEIMAEDRQIRVIMEDRVIKIPAEDRVLRIKSEDRSAKVPAEDRIIHVPLRK